MRSVVRWVSVSSCIALGMLAAGAPAVQAAPVVIDGLSQGSINLSSSGSVAGANNSGVDTLDGNRAVMLLQFFGSGSSTATLNPGGPLTVGGGFESLDLGYGYHYAGGGFQGSTADELHADLSGTTGIAFDFGSVSGQVSFIVSLLTDHNGSLGFLTNGNPGDQHFSTNSAGQFVVPFSGLQTISPGVDLSNVSYIDVQIDGSDYTLNSVSAVPEPTLTAGCVAGLGMMTLARRRRRRRA